MIEKKDCIVCGQEVIVLNCHYSCENCGFSENCHDMPHIIDNDWDSLSRKERRCTEYS